MDIFKQIFSWLGSKVTELGNAIISILPSSPFQFVAMGVEYKQWFAWANYFIPFQTLIGIGEAWLTCVAIYYLVMVGLRWAKVLAD